jgi:hypothetical protein
MRTTVTLDSDVEALLRKLMQERGLTFKEAVNSSLRRALALSALAGVTFATPGGELVTRTSSPRRRRARDRSRSPVATGLLLSALV